MSVENGTWRQAELLDELWRRLDEAERERLNFAKHRGIDPDRVESIVVVKRRGKGWRKAFVLTTVEAYFGLDAAE
jgi:hypothetical protein